MTSAPGWPGEVETTISSFTAQHAARKALYTAAQAAFIDDNEVDVVFGFRWPFRQRDWVAVVDTVSDIDPATVGSRRGVDERITLTVSLGSWRPEVPDRNADPSAVEIATADRAFGLLATLQEHVRLVDVTLGGTVAWCLPGGASCAGATTAEDSTQGRLTEISATFVCQHHIR